MSAIAKGQLNLTVNGVRRRVDAATVAELLFALGIEPKMVAVERNRAIVPKSLYRSTILADGDALEIVQFVGGG